MVTGRRLAFAFTAVAALALAGCQGESSIPKDIRPVPYRLTVRMQELGMKETSPLLIRLFKEESDLEVWKRTAKGDYALLKTYEICKWSGVLGPKVKEGDRQAPEGFYTVTPAQMNPQSKYYLAFNIGFPNTYDRALGRTGSNLMVHGACSSAGCYSMTDADAGELFALARDAFHGGQTQFQIQAFPFRMTPENMAKHRDSPHMAFWRNLKDGYDHFEVTHQVPKIDVCNKTYIFNADTDSAAFKATAACPAYTVPEPIAVAVAAKQAADEKKFSAAVIRFEEAARKADTEKLAEIEKAAKAAAEPAKPKRPAIFGRWLARGTNKPDAISAEPLAPAAIAAVPLPRSKPRLGAVTVPAVAKVDVTVPKPKPLAAATAPAVEPVATAPAVTPLAKAPIPATKPAIAPAPEPEPVVAMEPVPVASPAPAASPTPAGGGKVVKRKIDWESEPEAGMVLPAPLAP